MKLKFQLFDRREFLGAAGKVGMLVGLSSAIKPDAHAKSASTSNPFAYDLSRVEKTDPALVQYEAVAQWRVPHKEPRRMAIGPDDRLYVCASNYVAVMTL